MTQECLCHSIVSTRCFYDIGARSPSACVQRLPHARFLRNFVATLAISFAFDMRLDDSGSEIVQINRRSVSALKNISFLRIAALLVPEYEWDFHLVYEWQGCD